MAGTQFEPDQELCEKYAHFASHLGRLHFNILYWFLFMTNLMVLFSASWLYTKAQDSLEKYAHDSAKRARSLQKHILLCFACVLLSTVCVVMEAYALLALQFCDGEGLMSLYWATWTMIQIGSWIAMMGIILALAHAWRNRKHPPWALALGTPVLVIAGFLYLLHDCTSKRVKKGLAKQVGDAPMSGSPSNSEVNTVQVDPAEDGEYQGEFIGFTIDGGPIIRFTEVAAGATAGLDTQAEVIGFHDGGRPIVAYKKGCIRYMKASQ